MGLVSYGKRSLAAFGLMLMATQDFYPMVLVAHDLGENAAWLSAFLAALLAALLVWPVAAVLQRLPQGSLVELVQLAVGRAGLILFALVTIALFTISCGLILRETSEMALTAFFPHTPQTFATTALLLGAVYAAFGEGSALVRLGRMLLGLLLIAILLIIVGTLGWGNPRYLLPFWGPGPGQLLLRSPAVAMIYGPVMLVLYLLAGSIVDRSRLSRWLIAVPLAAGALYSLVKIDLVMVYTHPMGRAIPYPLHQAARLVLGGRFFERIEGIWLLVWVLATMLYLGAHLYGGALLFTRAFRIPSTRTAVLPLATLFLTAAFFSPDQVTTIVWHERSAMLTFLIALVLPCALALLAALRLRRRTT